MSENNENIENIENNKNIENNENNGTKMTTKFARLFGALKEGFEWVVAILFIVCGIFVIKYIYDRFFGPSLSSEEKYLLNTIENDENKIKELEKNIKNNLKKDDHLIHEKEKIQQNLDNLKREYYERQEEFLREEQEIDNMKHDDHLDYIKNKYGE